ncbi:MAG TPA: TIGR03435 family protein [Candidatus Acidoferrum sp.]|nr:TIGR03435 family protein [Candidatus Acidoferrum sp.]
MSATGLVAIAAPMVIGLAGGTPGFAQGPGQNVAQTQSQSVAPPAMNYAYEVVSIKPDNSPGFPNVTVGEDGLTILNIQLMPLFYSAFGVGKDQVIGAPDWLNTDKYDINAKIDPETADALKKLSADDRKVARQHMMQMIFIDRCNLKFHRDTKDLQVYNLVIGKNGPKIQQSKIDPATAPAPNAANNIRAGRGGVVEFRALPMTALVQILSQQLGATIVDKTGLTGLYDFTWNFAPDGGQGRGGGDGTPPAGGAGGGGGSMLPADPGGVSIFTQVQELLGLKLESSKGPIEVIVIDHIERPSDN